MHLCSLTLARWVKIFADDILKYFSYFSMNIGFNISYKLSSIQIVFRGDNLYETTKPIYLKKNFLTICMKHQSLFS